MAPRTFAVLGAGVAGLQAAHQLRHAGFEVTVFEKSQHVGGVWQSNYAGYALQVRKWHFVIPGYEWPDSESHPRYPTGAECQAYIERYASDAGLLLVIKFGAEVKSLTPQGSSDGADGWTVEWADEQGARRDAFDFVVVATGLFNKPIRPNWAEALASPAPPADPSTPWVVDVKDFTDESVAQGKRVVIIGAGKSAHDVGLVTSRVAASTTLVARRGHWMAPQKVLGWLPLEFATYTRWSWALQPAWYSAGKANKLSHKVFAPVKAAAWGLFGAIFTAQTSTPAALKPKFGLLTGIYDTIGMVDSHALSKAFRSGALQARAAHVERVDGKTLHLSDGSAIEADIVVLATGYQPIARTLLPSEALQTKAGYAANEEGSNYEQQWTYRNVLPPGLSNIAFIGQLATFAHVLTAALQSRWLVGVLAGEVALPPLPDRVADVEKQQAHWRKFPVPRSNNYVWAQVGKYHDDLVKDIKGSTWARSRWNLLGEWFLYVKNELYAPLFPAHKGLRGGSGGAKPAAARKTNGKITAASGGAISKANGANGAKAA